MPYRRKTTDEIYRRLASLVLARSRLTDLNEGSVVSHILTAVAMHGASTEIAVERLRDAFFMENLTGSSLDERARELPGGGVVRLGAISASGGVLSVVRENTDTEQRIAVGELSVENVETAGVLYRNVGEIVFPIGVQTVDNVTITAEIPGERGNASVNAVRRVINSRIPLLRVSNTQALSNGANAESDGDFLARIRLYISSLARCLPASLLFLGRSHLSESGERARFVSVWEDPARRGYSELVIDDGSGSAGGIRSGATSTGVVSANGVKVLRHEAPATAPIDRILVTRGGDPPFAVTAASGAFVSRHESGLVFVENGVLEEGDTWEISTNGSGQQYQVYTGLVKSLQSEVEPNFSRATTQTGWRPAGGRTVVRPAVRQEVSFDVRIVPRDGITLATVSEQVKEAAIAFMQTLEPGRTLYVSNLIAALDGIADVLSVELYRTGTSTPLGNQSPLDHFRSLRTNASAIRVIPQP